MARAQVAIWEDGVIWQAGRIQTTQKPLRDFAHSLCAWRSARSDQPVHTTLANAAVLVLLRLR
jgi:hypothetical protein